MIIIVLKMFLDIIIIRSFRKDLLFPCVFSVNSLTFPNGDLLLLLLL